MNKHSLKKVLIDFRLVKPAFGLSVLTYHGLVEKITNERLQRNFHTVKEFEDHLNFLKRNKFKVINALELGNLLNGDTSLLKHKLACITFDDGYENNLLAIDILKKKNCPGIFFLSTASIGSNTSIWTVNLSLLLLEGKMDTLEWQDRKFPMKDFETRNAAFNIIRNELKKVRTEDRQVMFEKILSQFQPNELNDLFQRHPYFKMLTWEEVRRSQDENISFQSHGHHHEIHNEVNSEFVIDEEIRISKKIIEKETQKPVFLFAYPNGNKNTHSQQALIHNNYNGALMLGNKISNDFQNRYAIPRYEPNRNIDKFKVQLYY